MDKAPLKFRSTSLADIELPKEVSGLRDLAYNLWWTWNPQARRMFAHIEPGLWAIYRNPVELLINIEPHHWEALLEDEVFLTMYKTVLREFETYTKSLNDTWFAQNHPGYQGGPFVYFSTEFGFHECLRTYSGDSVCYPEITANPPVTLEYRLLESARSTNTDISSKRSNRTVANSISTRRMISHACPSNRCWETMADISP